MSVPSLVTGSQRWPEVAQYATGVGFQSMLSVGIPPTRASLNLYSAQPFAFPEESEHVARVLASYTSVVLRCAKGQETWLGGGADDRQRRRWRRRRRSVAPAVSDPVLSCPACGMAIVLTDGSREAIDEAGLRCPSRSCGFVFKRAW